MQNNNPKIQFTPKQWVSFGLFFFDNVTELLLSKSTIINFFILYILFLHVSTLAEGNYKEVDRYKKK